MNLQDMQNLVNQIWEVLQNCNWAKYYQREKPTIEIKDNKRGCYRKWINHIIYPAWLLEKKSEFIWWYVAHELCHVFYSGHNEIFRALEKEICKTVNLTIVYSRAYPKLITQGSKIIFERHTPLLKKVARRYSRCSCCGWDILPGDTYLIRGSVRICFTSECYDKTFKKYEKKNGTI